MDALLMLFIALLLVFGIYMADVVLQLRGDVQVIRRKVNVLTASPNPPRSQAEEKNASKD
jgi:hypothetical protein